MTAFDYRAVAEVFAGTAGTSRRRPLHYRRFALASAAIRYAVEELPRELFLGTYLEVDEDRFDHHGIEQLYNSPDYPLARKSKPVRAGSLSRRAPQARAPSRRAEETRPAVTNTG